MSISSLKDKLVYLCNRTQVIYKKGKVTDTCPYGESQRHILCEKKPISKDCILYDYISMTFGKSKIIGIENRSVDTSN